MKIAEKPKLIAKSSDTCYSSTPKSNNKTEVNNQFEPLSGSESNCYEGSNESWEEDTIEKWACPWKIQHENIDIPLFYSPCNFYITRKSKHLQEMYNEIDEYATLNIHSSEDESMDIPDVDKYCLIKNDVGFSRGKIVDIVFDCDKCEIEVFLVDEGLRKKVDMVDIFEIPDYLIEKYPFQVRNNYFNQLNHIIILLTPFF